MGSPGIFGRAFSTQTLDGHMTSSSKLQAEGLVKWYGQIIAVNNLDFATDASIVGLLGPNGAGKSTLIKLLVGQLKPSKGNISLMGHKPWCNQALLAKLGYCPEHDRFYEDMSAAEFVTVLTRFHGYSQKQATDQAQVALQRLGLDEHAQKPIRNLSHGMRQRLKLAQAIAHKPRVLILDEPLSGMDPANRSQTIELLRQEADTGTFVLVSSHVLHELEAMTDHILLLNQGRMVAQGQVSKIRELIDAHPHRIALTCDRVRDLGRELLQYEDVVRIEVERSQLVVQTRDPDACYDRIGQLATNGEYQIQSMVSLDDNLQAVFRYLVK